ncbi:MAG TPA: hypothetical protein VES40_03085, partial [Ilumatobacteraceae bacterium]|nr:hypothetical protein [Ilumatobacteraceae bacterium]
MTDAATSPPDAAPPDAPKRNYLKWIIIGAIGLVVVVFGGILLYAYVLNDSPDELDAGDLSDALVVTVPETAPDPGAESSAVPVGTDPATTAPASVVDFNGDWTPTEASNFGYRVEEVLAGVNTTAVGRSNEITGLLTIDGTTATAIDVEVQIDSI